MRGGAAVDASAGLQHQNSGHKVRPHTLARLPRLSTLESSLCLRGRHARRVVKGYIYRNVDPPAPPPRNVRLTRALLQLALFFHIRCVMRLLYCFCRTTSACACMLFPLPKLECSGILVVSIWFVPHSRTSESNKMLQILKLNLVRGERFNGNT